MNPADVLEAAADSLWMYGRSFGTGVDDRGRMCVQGAVCHVQGLDAMDWVQATDTPAGAALRVFVKREHGLTYPFMWNDATKNDEDIIDGLKQCAKELRNAEAAS